MKKERKNYQFPANGVPINPTASSAQTNTNSNNIKQHNAILCDFF
jgi:hypothetical protein